MQLSSRFALVTLFQAALGGAIAIATAVAYWLAPRSLGDSGVIISVGGLGLLAAVYYLSVHQLLKKNHAKLSAALISIITGATISLIMAATGGIDSPYYALWVLGIVLAGIFGGVATIVTLVATIALYGFAFYNHGDSTSYIVTHSGQLAITLCVALVSEWVHLALGRSTVQHARVAALSGQLSTEALKSNVLMNSVSEGVLVVNTEHQIQLFNPAAVHMTGWDENSAQGIDYRLVLNLHDAAGNKVAGDVDPFAEIWQNGKSLIHNDFTMQTKGGHMVSISLSLSPIFDDQNQITGGIALFRDISSDKEIERQRNEFISTASHEMRTPVAAIEGYLSLAMNPSVATLDERAKNYLEKAHASTQHLGALFRDLLSVTKVENSNEAGNQEIFDLTAVTNETVADMLFAAKKKGLEIQFGTAEQSVRSQNSLMPLYAVRANAQRIREVIMNLIDNAIKFTPQGGINVTIGGTTDSVTVSVTDQGIGIAGEDIPHLFQKFYRIDSSATRTIGGTGLGLYLCRSIIEMFGGKIWVESKLGEGSSFKFSLPRQASEKIVAKDETQPASPTPAITPTPIPAINPSPVPGQTVTPAPAPPTVTDLTRPPVTA